MPFDVADRCSRCGTDLDVSAAFCSKCRDLLKLLKEQQGTTKPRRIMSRDGHSPVCPNCDTKMEWQGRGYRCRGCGYMED